MSRTLDLGVAGLGRAISLMLPTLRGHEAVRLVAAADPRPEARARFTADFGGVAYEDAAALAAHPGLDAVYVATPHQHHAAHAVAALDAGRHVLVEKPIAVTLADAHAIADAADRAGKHAVVGHSHSFDAPVALARALVERDFGRVRMVTALNFTDFLYRPRRPEELDTALGGGVVFSQAAHQLDVVRLLVGKPIRSVRAMAGSWDLERPTEGAYSALLGFEGGAFASLTYSGYAHYDSDELMVGIGETGRPKDPAAYGAMRRAFAARTGADAEAQAKAARNYGGGLYREAAGGPWHEHFGLVIVSCERGDLRLRPDGVEVFDDDQRRFEPLPRPAVPRREVIDELAAAVFDGRRPLHDARWGIATLEACHAILASAREGREVLLP